MRKLYICLGILLVGLAFHSCQDPMGLPGTSDGDSVTVGIDVTASRSVATRSAVSPTEDRISDYSVFIYTKGRLVKDIYVDSREATSVVLHLGQTYSLYALANTGDVVAPEAEGDLQDFAFRMSDISSLGTTLPMAQKYGEVTVDRKTSFSFVVERLASKVFFSLDALPVKGLRVSQVRMRQAPLCMYPFVTGGSKASAGDVADGDYASAADIEALNKGGMVVFYVLENLQGTLLPDNTDPWAKVPENITASGSCTYVEAKCLFSQDVDGREGEVFYRMYLGEDNITNFDIPRNTQMSLSLVVSEDNIDKVSWKLDADYIQHVTSLTLDKDDMTIIIGETGQLTATVLPLDADDRSVLWESSDPKVATVDANGKVTPLKPGTCVIKATSNDMRNIYDECNVTVKKISYGYRLVLSGPSIVYTGDTAGPYSLGYYTDTYTNDILTDQGNTLTLCGNSVVTWSISAGSEYASVTSDALVTGKANGKATLKATTVIAGTEHSAEKQISVYNKSGVGLVNGWTDGGSVDY